MRVVALAHGAVPLRNMGGEIAFHRILEPLVRAGHDVTILTKTDAPFEFEGVKAEPINIPDVLDVNSDPAAIANQIGSADLVIGLHDLSLAAVRAAALIGAPSVVNVHAPPKFGRLLRQAILEADYGVYNTLHSAKEWREPTALVVHPPSSPIPSDPGVPQGDAYVMLSNLWNKGGEVVLELAKRMPDKRFLMVRSPAEDTHGVPDFDQRVLELPNVEVHPRVNPEDVADRYFSQARILLVPSKYETYGMSAIEAAGYGIPSIHVDTPHAREGVGSAAIFIPPLGIGAAEVGILATEANYEDRSRQARGRAEWLAQRQDAEISAWIRFAETVQPLGLQDRRVRQRRLAFFNTV